MSISKPNTKIQYVNIGWACTNLRQEDNAIAYAVHMASRTFDEIGNLLHQFHHAVIKHKRNVTREGFHTNRRTGYGRMTVMFSSNYVPGSINVLDIKTKRGEYVLPYTTP